MLRPSKEPTLSDAARLTFKLDELEKPKALDIELSEGFLAGLLKDATSPFRAKGAGRLHGQLSAVDHGALLRGGLTATVVTECRRCLVPVDDTVDVPLLTKYLPRRELEAREARPDADPESESARPKGGDLDEEPFDGHRIDLSTAIREQLLLALPMAELCREDCKGLCPSCGQNLNEKTCDCRPDAVDPRWQRLKGLKLDN